MTRMTKARFRWMIARVRQLASRKGYMRAAQLVEANLGCDFEYACRVVKLASTTKGTFNIPQAIVRNKQCTAIETKLQPPHF